MKLWQPKKELPPRHYGRGFSIIELMISITIGLIILAGVIQVVIGSKQNRLEQEEVSFIQDNARFAVEMISSDMRMAGYMGCASPGAVQLANSISNNANGFIGFGGLEGFEGETNTTSFPTPVKTFAKVGTDAIIIRRGDNDSEMNVKSHNASSAVISLWGQHSFDKGTTLMIADATCRNVGLFQVSGPNGLPANNIVHNTGAGTNNCTKIIRGNFACIASCTATSCNGYGTSTGTYGPGSKVMAFKANAYFIADSVVYPGVPVLKRQYIDLTAASGTRSEELALGVEDMELLYGVDTNADGEVNQYRKASQMDVDSNGTINSADWDKVISVRISLTFRSQNPVFASNTSGTYNGVTYNDRYLRQAVSTTVQIRNRG